MADPEKPAQAKPTQSPSGSTHQPSGSLAEAKATTDARSSPKAAPAGPAPNVMGQNLVLTGRYKNKDGKAIEVLRVEGQDANDTRPKKVFFHDVDADRGKQAVKQTGDGDKDAQKPGDEQSMSLEDFLKPADEHSDDHSPAWKHENPPPADATHFAPI